jgi:ketosteroid isomerase-like protein
MSDQNVELVRRFFDVGLDAESLIELGLVDPELTFVPGPGSLTTGTLTAKGFEDVVRDIASQFEAYDVTPVKFVDAGERVVVELRRCVTIPRSSTPLEDRFAHVFTVHDGRIVRIQSFFELDEALQAAKPSDRSRPETESERMAP